MQKRIPKSAIEYIKELIQRDREKQYEHEPNTSKNAQELAWYYKGRADALENIVSFLEKI